MIAIINQGLFRLNFSTTWNCCLSTSRFLTKASKEDQSYLKIPLSAKSATFSNQT